MELDTVTKANLDGLTINDVRETLARAATSTDPTDLGDVRAAISWLFVRAQVDNPDFAKNLLANPSDEYKTILNIVKNDLNFSPIHREFYLSDIEDLYKKFKTNEKDEDDNKGLYFFQGPGSQNQQGRKISCLRRTGQTAGQIFPC